MNILRVEAQTFVHATEELDAVVSCLGEILNDSEIDYSVEHTYGHFKNPIDIVKVQYRNQKAARVFDTLVENMSTADREHILEEIERRFDDKLHIRLDKIGACCGKTRIGKGINVAATITSYPFNRNKIIKELKEIFRK